MKYELSKLEERLLLQNEFTPEYTYRKSVVDGISVSETVDDESGGFSHYVFVVFEGKRQLIVCSVQRTS